MLRGLWLLALVMAGSAAWANPVEEVLRHSEKLSAVAAAAPEYRLQILLGLIEEGPDGKERLVQHGFRVDEEYFYPASTVKLGAAVAALEFLAGLRESTGLDLEPQTPLRYHPLFDDEVLEEADASNLEGGKITVQHEIRKLFLVSDNVAFNRLYELVGPDLLHLSLHRAALASARITHRLSERRSVLENRRTPKVELLGPDFVHVVEERQAFVAPRPIGVPGLRVGRAFLEEGKKVEAPLDFRTKNRISLRDLQRMLALVVRPDLDLGGESFVLREADRQLLLEAMSQLPRKSKNPVYGAKRYPDDYVKFLLPGLAKVVPAKKLTIYNKIGQAYGFTTENAYVVGPPGKRPFFLAATLYTNADGVLNDDAYEYEEIAQPFLADLGEALARRLWDR